MTYADIFTYCAPGCFLIVVLYLTGLIAYETINKHPVVTRWHWAVLFTLIGLLPIFLHAYRQVSDPPWFGLDTIFLATTGTIGIPLLIVWSWFAIKGWIIPGTAPKAIREILKEVLDSMKLGYEDEHWILLKDHNLRLTTRRFLFFRATILQIKGSNSELAERIAQNLQEALKGREAPLLNRAKVDQFLLILLLTWLGTWSWCSSTQCQGMFSRFF